MMDIRITTLIYMRENGQEPPSSMSFAEQDALVADDFSWIWRVSKRLVRSTSALLTLIFSIFIR